jgi:hypothetical protein
VALERQGEFLRPHAAAVVADRDEAPPAVAERNGNGARPSVEGVLHQLLDHRRRALDDLAGGDAVDQGLGQAADGHGGGSSPLR